jgi:hypothetical protein
MLKILAAFCFLVALVWIGIVLGAQRACPIHASCTGPLADAWMPAYLTSVVGIPAVIVSVIIIVFVVIRAIVRG